MTRQELKSRIVAAGVKNLRDFGYPSCNPENIKTDMIYRAFFESALRDNLGAGAETDAAIMELLDEIAVDA